MPNPGQLAAQDTATLAGTVLDQAGKAVGSATVMVRNDATGATGNTTSDPEGHYSVSSLPVGTYTVEVTANGFAKATRTGVQLPAAGVEDVGITLSVASLTQALTVQGTASVAAQTAPTQASLDEESPHAEISQPFVENFTSPDTDFTNVMQYAPGSTHEAVSINPFRLTDVYVKRAVLSQG